MTSIPLVERLRSAVTYTDEEGVLRKCYPGGDARITAAMLEAADLIETLTAALAAEKERADALNDPSGTGIRTPCSQRTPSCLMSSTNMSLPTRLKAFVMSRRAGRLARYARTYHILTSEGPAPEGYEHG